jgi:hypothetical protein
MQPATANGRYHTAERASGQQAVGVCIGSIVLKNPMFKTSFSLRLQSRCEFLLVFGRSLLDLIALASIMQARNRPFV